MGEHEPQSFRSASPESRREAAWATLLPVTFVGIAVAALHGSTPPYFDVAGAAIALPLLAYLIARAATISIDADGSRVTIRNPYRTWVLRWDEIETVERSTKAAPFGNQRQAIRFRTTSPRKIKIKALAVPRSQEAQQWVVEQLLSLAPSHVVVRSEAARQMQAATR